MPTISISPVRWSNAVWYPIAGLGLALAKLAASEAAWNGLPLVLSDCGSADRLVGDEGARGRVVPNPLGDPLDVTWERLRALPSEAHAVNEDALVEALLDVLAARDTWAERGDEIRAHARSELHPHRVGAAYAELFRSVATAP